MRTLILAGLGIIIATAAWAGSYTVTTTADQDAALKDLAANPPRVAGTAPATPGAIVQAFVDRSLSSAVQNTKRKDACAKITDAAQKAALRCPTPVAAAPAPAPTKAPTAPTKTK